MLMELINKFRVVTGLTANPKDVPTGNVVSDLHDEAVQVKTDLETNVLPLYATPLDKTAYIPTSDVVVDFSNPSTTKVPTSKAVIDYVDDVTVDNRSKPITKRSSIRTMANDAMLNDYKDHGLISITEVGSEPYPFKKQLS